MPKKKDDSTPETQEKKKTTAKAAKAEAEAAKENSELTQLREELDKTKDSLLRLAAEYDNFRKRSQKEKEQAYGDSKADVISKLLPVMDNFDRALGNNTGDYDTYKKGIEMTFKQLTEILAAMGVEAFGSTGDEFNPTLHNAVMRIDSAELPENTVATVFVKGYKMGDRIIRCADIQVAN